MGPPLKTGLRSLHVSKSGTARDVTQLSMMTRVSERKHFDDARTDRGRTIIVLCSGRGDFSSIGQRSLLRRLNESS